MPGVGGGASGATQEKDSTLDKMATLNDLKEVLDAGLVSQADYDNVKREYLRAKLKALEANQEASEYQKIELRAKKEALEANKELQRKELRAREEALEVHKKGISECRKMELCARKRPLRRLKSSRKSSTKS